MKKSLSLLSRCLIFIMHHISLSFDIINIGFKGLSKIPILKIKKNLFA